MRSRGQDAPGGPPALGDDGLDCKELTPKEREAHTTIYAGMLKKHGAVVEGRKAQGQAKTGNVIGPKSLGSNIPTVTRKAAADLGITDEAVRNRVRNASKLAARGRERSTRLGPAGAGPYWQVFGPGSPDPSLKQCQYDDSGSRWPLSKGG